MIRLWLAGLIRHRGGRLAATAAGVAVAVALLGSLGAFLTASKATMTARATTEVAVDWQVQVTPSADPAQVFATVRSDPGTRAALPVGFAPSPGFGASTAPTAGSSGPTTQQTGPGVVVGLPPDYATTFPGELRVLAGRSDGVLLAQQTASNLHAAPGDTVVIGRSGLPPVPLVVDGIVALPQADSLFQRVGAPTGAQPSAPPDNVVLLPAATWRAVTDGLAISAPGTATTQIHAARNHGLPADPAAAYSVATGEAKNLELRSGGTAVVGDNLAATLDKARQDAAYAQVLFLFLGTPGAVLAALLTAALAASGADRRRRQQALLRVRGADTHALVGLAGAEAALVGITGSLLGIGGAAAIGALVFGSARFGATPGDALAWIGTAALLGLLVAAATVLAPAWRDLRGTTVNAERLVVGRRGLPAWARYGLDIGLLAAAGLVFWISGRSGYQLVLAPEGVPTISVSYWAFAGPALLWAGGGLLAWRLSDLLLGRGRHALAKALRPMAGSLAATAAAMSARRRRMLGRSIVLLGLALAFAASTATFNATYRAQAEVDAQLTNGADVTVTPSPGAPVGPGGAGSLTTVPGVRAVEPIQHRFAYVGTDLQDLYGVDPATITRATTVSDQYFVGGTARQFLDRLAAAPDSILVSAETAADFQLRPGDTLNLRLPAGPGGATTMVPFRFGGVVTEFPTAPKDSFLVANAGYVAAATGSDAVGAFLVDTGGQQNTAVADRVRDLLGPTATVSDIAAARNTVGSSLTSVDLTGLTRVELGFALLLAAAAGGLVLALGLVERRRSFALVALLGGRPSQIRRLAAAEATVLVAGGLAGGAVMGWAVSEMLVAVLTGVFDPPPTAITVPWTYLVIVAALAVAAVVAGTAVATRHSRRATPAILREL